MKKICLIILLAISLINQPYCQLNLHDGLVAYYPFNGNANDESGNGNNGTQYGVTCTNDRFGNQNSAFFFDGVDDNIEILHSGSLNITEGISISFWTKFETSGPYYYPPIFIYKYLVWGTWQRENDINWEIFTYDGQFNVWALDFDFNKWYHFVVKYDGSNISIYVNGQLNVSAPAHGSIKTSTNNVYISRHNNGGDYYFDGTLDDFRIYNRALNDAEINYLYNEGGWPTLNAGIIFNPDLTYGSVNDIEGNIYKTIQIGTQTWMAENLKTTKYNDGKIIPLGTDIATWVDLTSPAYCWYLHDESTYKNTYGALYNWYATNTEKLCPIGWHIPADLDWTTLIDRKSTRLNSSHRMMLK
jgi:hypothetical protein